jgi:hypothetical protein
MSKKTLIEIDEDKFNRILIELKSSREQLLDVDEKDWSEEVAALEDYIKTGRITHYFQGINLIISYLKGLSKRLQCFD